MRAVSLFGSLTRNHSEPLRELEVSLSGSHKKSGEAFVKGLTASKPP